MTTRMTLDQAFGELAAIENELSALAASKCEASKTSTAFSKWRSSVNEKTNERERLEIRITTLKTEDEQEERDAARADLRSRRAALEKQTAALARRINEDGSKAAETLIQLAEEAKANAVDVQNLNRELSGDEQLIHADEIARNRDPTPRKTLEETTVDLWTFQTTGQLVGDQDSVVELSNGRGTIPATEHSLTNKPVIRKQFRQIRYLKPIDRAYADPLGSVLRLPRFDAPGMLFDLGHKVEPARRKELMELIPVPDAPGKPAKSPDGRT